MALQINQEAQNVPAEPVESSLVTTGIDTTPSDPTYYGAAVTRDSGTQNGQTTSTTSTTSSGGGAAVALLGVAAIGALVFFMRGPK